MRDVRLPCRRHGGMDRGARCIGLEIAAGPPPALAVARRLEQPAAGAGTMARSEVVGRWWAASHADGLTCTAALIVSCPPQEQAERRADLNATRPVFLPCGAGSAVPEAEPAGSLFCSSPFRHQRASELL